MLVLGLIGLAYGNRLGGFISGMLHLSATTRIQAILWMLGIILSGFSFLHVCKRHLMAADGFCVCVKPPVAAYAPTSSYSEKQ